MKKKGITRRQLIKQGGLAITALALPTPMRAFTKFYNMTDNKRFEVIIIGGSYAGLSAAMALGRSLRDVLIIDSGKPCNRQTPHSHNFLTQDGVTPKEIATRAKQQVEKYETVKFHNGLVNDGVKTDNGFEITTINGDRFTAKKIVFATGIKDTMPDIKGFSECWGKSVVHCPYCHGYENRDKNTAIIANGAKAFHLAPLVKNLTNTLTILTNGKADFEADQLVKLKEHNINLIETKILELEHHDGFLDKVVFTDKTKLAFDVAYGVVPFTQHSDIPQKLGCEITEQGYIKVDMFQKTTVDGVFACGDNSVMMRSVANAVYSGNVTGAVVNAFLLQENF